MRADVRQLALLGSGEHAAVVVDAARSAGRTVAGFVGPADATAAGRMSCAHLGGDDVLEGLDAELVLGVGALRVTTRRRALAERADAAGVRWACVVHASATIARTAIVSAGAVVLAGAIVQPGAFVGRHVIVNTGAVVEHDVRLGDFAIIAPRAVIGGASVVEADAFIGLGACVRDHVCVGRGATVGMGAAVVSDVPDGLVVVGVPARAPR